MTSRTPSHDALIHQQKLLNYLTMVYQEKKEKLSFADFMQIALYAPGLGYYSAGNYKIGTKGDFTTAPEISPLFSYCIGAELIPILQNLSDPIIVELGAGSGKMAADILHFLTKKNQLPRGYWILEVSADLKARQQHYLQQHCPHFIDNIFWLSNLPKESFNGIILGNEVIDAMPVHLFQIGKHNEIREGVVSYQKDRWHIVYQTPLTPGLVDAVNNLQHHLDLQFAPGFTSEINLHLSPWLQSLSTSLQQGVMLFLDYGFPQHEYYHPSRSMGTLMCHHQHRAHTDPMLNIGLQDITAHVDFTALAKAGSEASLSVAGFTSQAAFLLANEILSLAGENNKNIEDQIRTSQQIQQLTHPHEMGELFKAIAFTKNYTEPLQGFQFIDHRHRL